MKIVRAGIGDTDLFSDAELDHGACCFYSEDRQFRYFFAIRGREATVYANTDRYVGQAIDEFLFYSGFVTSVRDENGRVWEVRTPNEPHLHEIADIQPSQFYVVFPAQQPSRAGQHKDCTVL